MAGAKRANHSPLGWHLSYWISYYAKGKQPQEYLFPNNNDGSTKSFEKNKSQRLWKNVFLKIIAKDAVIEGASTIPGQPLSNIWEYPRR